MRDNRQMFYAEELQKLHINVPSSRKCSTRNSPFPSSGLCIVTSFQKVEEKRGKKMKK